MEREGEREADRHRQTDEELKLITIPIDFLELHLNDLHDNNK